MDILKCLIIKGLLSVLRDREVSKSNHNYYYYAFYFMFTVKHARRRGNLLVCSNGDPRLTPTHLTAMPNFVT